ncbi:MAG TPA: AAA family ATPase, partial [Pedobacter sp.]|uniref:AAA family ATPase n=1 Tax=Pedobacter sp. TaxID=1411316 RepID=UPI002C389653
MQFENDIKAVDALHLAYNNIKSEIGKIVIGQEEVVKSVLISIFSNGHCLLVGVPGLAKTLLVQTVADVMDLQFNRIQFTPDLMPSDIIGAEILGEDRNFKFIHGPVFSNIVLADEINRTPPKTQAALLEAMQEKAVTAAGQRHVLPNPFFVLATQNPIEQEGTYPLPEAQLDRFMFNIHLDYPSFAEELTIVKSTTSNTDVKLKKIIDAKQIQYFQKLIRNIPVTDNVVEYAVKLASKTRPNTALATEDI